MMKDQGTTHLPMEQILEMELRYQTRVGIQSQSELLSFLNPHKRSADPQQQIEQQQVNILFFLPSTTLPQREPTNKKTLPDLLSKEMQTNAHKKYQSLLDPISLLRNEVRSDQALFDHLLSLLTSHPLPPSLNF
jgi:hypothetical protein